MEHGALGRDERDGIPVWWADVPGEFAAALQFRVGHADERFHEAGVTHLVEHLTFATVGRREHDLNGYVDRTECVFYAEGERAEVLEFLRLVAAALAGLPMGELERERRVLRAEAAQREAGVDDRLLFERFGLAGYGLAGHVEVGLRWVGEPELRAWCARFFTRGNAALWMTGEPPADFVLALPDGPRVPPPAPDPLPLRLPAFLARGTGGAAIAGQGRRTSALGLARDVAEERLFTRLRTELGLSYAPYADYRPLGTASAHVVLGADGRDEDGERLLAELWECVKSLADAGATEEELDRARRAIDRARRDPRMVHSDLAFAAACELDGLPYAGEAGMAAQREAVDGAAVAEALGEVLASALVLGPEGSRFPALPELSAPDSEPVEGERFLRRRVGVLRRRVDEELRIGERGVTLSGDGEAMTFEWPEVVAVETRPTGELRLSARDDRMIALPPFLWEDGERALALVRSFVPEELAIPPAGVQLTASIERAVARRRIDVAGVAGPLAELPDELGDDELVLDLALAVRRRGFVPGLLVVTERRVLWGASVVEDGFAFPRQDVVSARVVGGELRLEWEGGDVKLVIDPKGAAADLAAAIQA